MRVDILVGLKGDYYAWSVSFTKICYVRSKCMLVGYNTLFHYIRCNEVSCFSRSNVKVRKYFCKINSCLVHIFSALGECSWTQNMMHPQNANG